MKLFQKFIFRINSFLKTDLFQTSFWNGIATLIKIGIGLISNKIVAVYLGPSGMALLGQFSNFISMATSFATGGINSGVTKYLAEYIGEDEKQNRVLSTGFKSTLITTLIVALFVLIGADYFCNTILHTAKFKNLFYIFSVTLILFTLNGFFISVLNGFKEFKKIVYVNISTSFIGLAIAIFLVITYGVYGALLGLVLSTTLIAFITFSLVYNSPWFSLKKLWQKFDFLILKKLSNYSLMTFSSIFAVTYIQLSVRTYIINHISIQDAGYWQGVVKISDIYLSIITTTLSIYYLPRLSEIKEDRELRAEIFKGYKFLLPLTIFSSSLIYTFRRLIVRILFSDSFEPMQDFFLLQMMGDIFKIASWLFAYILIAKALIKKYIFLELLFGAIYYFFSIYFISLIGIKGAFLSYLLNYILYFLFLLLIFFRGKIVL